MYKTHFYLPILIISLLLSACQSDSVSLNEAENITAEFSGGTFSPPPRTIDDLARQLPKAEIPPTENLAFHCDGQERDGKRLEQFKDYLTRYEPDERIDTAADPVGNWNIKYGWQLYRGISISETQRGNLARAEEAQKQYLAAIPHDKKGPYIPGYSNLALIQINRGDLSAGLTSISKAKGWENRRNAPKRKIHSAWLAGAEGEMALAKGDLATAEKRLRVALKNFIEHKERGVYVALTRSKLAQVIAAQGRLLEAENEARLALAHSIEYNRLGNIRNSPIVHRFAGILIDQGRIKEAEIIAASAVWTYQQRCSPAESIEFADARKMLAETLALQGRYEETLAIYDAIEASLGKEPLQYRSRFGNDLTLAYALINQNKIQRAYARLQKAVEQLSSSYGKNHPRSAEAKGFLAIAEWKIGLQDQAEQHFMEAVSILQNPKLRNGVRPQNLRIIIENYMEMVSEQVRENPEKTNTLFMLAESLRNSVVEESISAMGARAAVSTPALASLLRKEQNARARISALESTLSNAVSEGLDSTQLKASIEQFRKAQVTILNEIITRFPEYAELLHPSPLSLQDVQQYLKPDEAFIATYTSTDKTYVWALVKDLPVHFSTFPVGKHQMRQRVANLRSAFAPTGISLASIPEYNVSAAFELYQNVLGPSQHIWKNRASLIVAAHSSLGHIPFSVLPTKMVELPVKHRPLFSHYRKIPFLVKTHTVTSMPSANALRSLRSVKIVNKQQNLLVAFGDPWFNDEHEKQGENLNTSTVSSRGGFNFRASPITSEMSSATINLLPRLPETADELKEIAIALGEDSSSSIYLGKDANEARVKSLNLTSYSIIVFATHGLVPGDLDGLTQPALALSSPQISNTKGDGLLTMDEIMNLNVSADWVVLSACNTGSSDGSAAEAVSGLGRAFFYAGARSLLVSNWPVETSSARMLTTGIFKSATASSNRAEALRQSMTNLIDDGVYRDHDSGKIIYSYAHPIFWAPFSLVGDGQPVN